MKMEMTELGPMKRALKIEVPAEEVTQRITRAYVELNRQVNIPGFRPGKVPLALLEKRYAKTVEEDVIRALVPDFYEKAIRQAGVVPVHVEIPPLDRVQIKKNEPFTFTATVEIKPNIELRDYKAPSPISLKPDKRTVTDEQLDRGLEVLREQQSRLEATPLGHIIVDGDYIVLDLHGTLDGSPLEGTKKEGQLHKVGSHAAVLGLEIDSHVGGKKDGDVLEISQPYPANHPDPRVAGKTVLFTLTIKSVKEKKLPALDDEFAKDCGPYTSLQEIKDKLREGMEQALKREIEDNYKDTIVKRLMDTHHFDLPEILVERELEAIIRQHVQQQQRKSDTQEQTGTEDVTRLRQEHRDEAARRVKVSLVLEEIAQKEGLTVTQDDFNSEVMRLASELKMPAADLVKMIKAGGQESIDDLRTRILVDKALDFVYRNAMIQG